MTDSELNEKLNNDFRAFRMEHDSRIAQKYVEQIPGKGLSEENFTPQEKNKLASLTGGADIDTSQFATKAELQTAISNVAIDSLSSNDVYIPATTYNSIMKNFDVATVSAGVNLTEFLTKWATAKIGTTPMGEYTAEDIYNAALNVSQASRALISDDLYLPQESLAHCFEDVSTLEPVLLSMQSSISESFITTATFTMDPDIYSTDKVITIKMADVFLQYLKANNIVPTIMYFTHDRITYKITDDNWAWFNVIANGSFEKITANNLADATELYACCRQISEFADSDYISPDISAGGNFPSTTLFAVV